MGDEAYGCREFDEMLLTTTGKLLESITVRDFNVGRAFPILRYTSVDNVVINEDNLIDVSQGPFTHANLIDVNQGPHLDEARWPSGMLAVGYNSVVTAWVRAAVDP